MEYEVKNIKTDNVSNSEDGLSLITTSVITSGIVGDNYGFNRFDSIKVETSKNLSVNETETAILNAAKEFVKEKYPNT